MDREDSREYRFHLQYSHPFYGELCLQGDKSLLKSNFFKESLVDFNGIKGGISKICIHLENQISFQQRYPDEPEGSLCYKK